MVDIRKTIRSGTRGKVPRVPFEAIAHAIFPKEYELSLVICGDALGRKMNRLYRKKNYAPNVLSFPLDASGGEMFLNARVAEREARKYDTSFKKRLTFLFIHGCLHLKGMEHGQAMEERERILQKRFA